jgi:preprotein translocase subunit SecA
MFGYLAKKLFGSANDRIIKQLQPILQRINALEKDMQALSDEQLRAKTTEFKRRLAEGETIDSILPEAFAAVREASVRTLGMRHFDVQIIGGLILHKGMIAEMKTGEGKTLVATLPVYLNALSGKGVHVVSVNDYLITRDSAWMGKIYEFLGLTVGHITSGIDKAERKAAYQADITYGTNNEFGFDYLRDNLCFEIEAMVQRKHHYAIIDEVDSILIDEARTPLIISGPTEDNSELYIQVNRLIPKLEKEDYEVDEKSRSTSLTDQGNEKIEKLLKEAKIISSDTSLYDYENMTVVHHINQALKAHQLFKVDKDYIIKNKQVMIIDEFTGRIMEGRRYSEGLHQALEAKEGVPIQNENQTLASVTFQNYFRMYEKLAGMTGTAMTEAQEFADIYKLEVVSIPTHNPVKRIDNDDEIYSTADAKYNAIIEEIARVHKTGQPILVGTVSIEKSEYLSSLLKKHKIPHNVLNARYHAQEAEIIAQAGRSSAVTIATNMAGRGTDIKLGGNAEMLLQQELATSKKKQEADLTVLLEQLEQKVIKDKELVIEKGGLLVLGTERHESRRIDNQLRGRCGRQGDPGRTKFYLSLEDDLMRIFGSDKISGLLTRLGLKEGEAIIHPWISKSLEKSQSRVEMRNYDIRKNLLKFDDVMNDQRKVIYQQRLDIMRGQDENGLDVDAVIEDMVEEISGDIVARHIRAESFAEEWDIVGLEKEVHRIFGEHMSLTELAKKEGVANEEIVEHIMQRAKSQLVDKASKYGEELFSRAKKQILLMTLDQMWKDHLLTLDHLRAGIGLRAYGQKDPLNEYKIEAFQLFEKMLKDLSELAVVRVAHFELAGELETLKSKRTRIQELRHDPLGVFGSKDQDEEDSIMGQLRTHVNPQERDPSDPSTWGKISRNEVCPCGSGRKYKYCHGAVL